MQPQTSIAIFGAASVVLVFACVGAEPLPPLVNAQELDAGSNPGSSSGTTADSGVTIADASVNDAADAAFEARKRIFVTTGMHSGNFGGLKGGDDFCQVAAKAVTSGTFIAFLSLPGANAIDRLLVDGPWYSMDRQTLIFSGKRTGTHPISGLAPKSPINQNQLAQVWTGPETRYWTGTNQGGEANPNNHCEQWTSDTVAPFASGLNGRTGVTDKGWTDVGSTTCYSPQHVLCFEQ